MTLGAHVHGRDAPVAAGPGSRLVIQWQAYESDNGGDG